MFKKFVFAYGSAIVVIVILLILGQSLIQYSLYYEIQSRLTATSVGRQQLRVQKMAKDILALENANQNKIFYLNEIKQQDAIWEKTQSGIEHGDASLNLPSKFSSDVASDIQKTQGDYLNMQSSLQKILFVENNHLPVNQLTIPANTFLFYMPEYAYTYANIFSILVNKADNEIYTIQLIEVILFSLALLTMFFEVFFIVIPETRKIQKDYNTQKLIQKRE